MRLLAIALAVGAISWAGVTHAHDKITIRKVTVPRVASSEVVSLEIVRDTVPCAGYQLPIDKFFATVNKVLKENAVGESQRHAGPDSPWISLSIELDGQKISLTSDHLYFEGLGRLVLTDHGLEPLNGRDKAAVIAQQSIGLRQFRSAFEGILQLSSDYLRKEVTDDKPDVAEATGRVCGE